MQVQNPTAFVIVAVVFLAFTGFAIYSAIKRREEVFEGQVVDKDVIETETMNNYEGPGMNRPGITIGNTGGGIKHTYRIKVQTDQGNVINYKISEGMYEIIKIGDRVAKAKGTTEISVVSSQPSTAVPPAPSVAGPQQEGPKPPESLV